VPEHVETRSLYNPEAGPELEQGKIQMWIDIFPLGEYRKDSIPKPVDVSVRKPKKFQLRVIIFNTKDVILDDTNILTGEKTSDIYVKGFLCDRFDEQRTDVHYRSLNGEGNFNWRFIFDFDYLPAEQRIVYSQKQRFGFVSIDRKLRPKFTLQCYDADQITADDKLGEIELNLNKLIRGATTAQNCTLKMIKEESWPKVNLFKDRHIRGWWPFIANDPLNNNRSVITVNQLTIIIILIFLYFLFSFLFFYVFKF
jgi:otoferlin